MTIISHLSQTALRLPRSAAFAAGRTRQVAPGVPLPLQGITMVRTGRCRRAKIDSPLYSHHFAPMEMDRQVRRRRAPCRGEAWHCRPTVIRGKRSPMPTQSPRLDLNVTGSTCRPRSADRTTIIAIDSDRRHNREPSTVGHAPFYDRAAASKLTT
jgi:hypothetical protein